MTTQLTTTTTAQLVRITPCPDCGNTTARVVGDLPPEMVVCTECLEVVDAPAPVGPGAVPAPVEQFRAGQSLMSLQMSRGHAMRFHHQLTGYYTPTDREGITRLVKTCCDGNGGPVPA